MEFSQAGCIGMPRRRNKDYFVEFPVFQKQGWDLTVLTRPYWPDSQYRPLSRCDKQRQTFDNIHLCRQCCVRACALSIMIIVQSFESFHSDSDMCPFNCRDEPKEFHNVLIPCVIMPTRTSRSTFSFKVWGLLTVNWKKRFRVFPKLASGVV